MGNRILRYYQEGWTVDCLDRSRLQKGMQARWEGSGSTTIRLLHQFFLLLQGSMVQCCPVMSGVLVLRYYQEGRAENCLDWFHCQKEIQSHCEGLG